jgi:hypothetical protein
MNCGPVLCLPVWLTLGLKMSLSQKLGLIAVLSLGGIVTVFSIIRVVVTYTVTTQPEVSWLALWSSIESSIAVMVACLASFKVLFTLNKGGSSARSKYADIENSARRNRTGTASSRQHGAAGSMSASRATASKHDDLDLDETELRNLNRRSGKNGDITVTQTIQVSENQKKPARYDRDRVWDDDRGSQERILH